MRNMVGIVRIRKWALMRSNMVIKNLVISAT